MEMRIEQSSPLSCRREFLRLACAMECTCAEPRGPTMTRSRFQFGLSSLLWFVVFAAFNFWLFSLGSWGGIVALTIDKHVLVAYLCMKFRVDERGRAGTPVAALPDAPAESRAVGETASLAAA